MSGGLRKRIGRALASVALGVASGAGAEPSLVDPGLGLLERVTPPGSEPELPLVDGLAFDPLGNLFAALEIAGAAGGVVAVDVGDGAVTRIASGIPRADQVALVAFTEGPERRATFVVTSEVRPGASSGRLFLVGIRHGADGRPLAPGNVFSLITRDLLLDNPEGVAVLETGGPYGAPGTLLVAEDLAPGRIVRIDATPSTLAAGLARPEGLAFGDFAGAAEPALYAAETSRHRVIRVGSDGAVTTLGAPEEVGLTFPDNVEFGPDGFLYTSEDRPEPQSRIVRIAADGRHEVVATGFGQASGLAFHPETGDLYLSEQDRARIWRLRFAREVAIEVRPGRARPRVLAGGHGVVPVALFGSERVPVAEIDRATLALGRGGAAPGPRPPRAIDLDRDGFADLLLHFRADAAGIGPDDTEICISGAFLDGRPLRGCAPIEVRVPPRRRPESPHPASHGRASHGRP